MVRYANMLHHRCRLRVCVLNACVCFFLFLLLQVFDNYAVTVMIGGEPYTLGLFDTAGTMMWLNIRSNKYKLTYTYTVCDFC